MPVKNTYGVFQTCTISVVSCMFLMIFPGFIRSYSIIHGLWVNYLAFFLVEIYLFLKFSEYRKYVLLSFSVALLALMLAICINDGIYNFAFPTLVCFLFSGAFAYIFVISKSVRKKVITLLFFCSFGVINVFWIFPVWLNYLNFNNFNSKVSEYISPEWINYVKEYDKNTLQFTHGKLVLLDFYNTGCGVCFRKFPMLQQVFDRYKNISVYAVDIPLSRDTGRMALKMIEDRHYTFPILIGKDKTDSLFKITSYPTTILIKDNTIVYRGSIDDIQNILEDELKKMPKAM